MDSYNYMTMFTLATTYTSLVVNSIHMYILVQYIHCRWQIVILLLISLWYLAAATASAYPTLTCLRVASRDARCKSTHIT